MTHAEMVEVYHEQNRKHAEACAKFEAEARRYKAMTDHMNLVVKMVIDQINAPLIAFAEELKRETK